mmetsp:Transcript_2256/g.3248  ORF Transcript_2256/g.3248 Transcript_2256/m.3248 type:complete len:433 (+) Transcript_2256:195-1493(+)|eukprot:CAMPEP_0178921488 /NCGR_PEP_ID=MMETSP0786-20121207/15590_1 /TAXON_ID=186022 /ORGANISM="Thalassionema frauenfeldii, Strain CCMP 1798" /LENGTH=432 /DNA_ID=CAMNT_0020595675 /DNA_START=185 /DNA_END=1483 /DNA_ORIENTATION=-
MSSFSVFLVLVASFEVVVSQLVEDIEFSWNPTKLPIKLSDSMANYMQGDNGDEDGFIIITGGCDSHNGNEKLAVDSDFASCMSTSKATFKFDPFENTFERMEDSNYERQRHTAVVMDGELYVFGGRDTDDNLVAEIESFNPKANTWTSRGKLPENIVTSDLTGWAWKNYIYLTGGFVADYSASGGTIRIDFTDNPSELTEEHMDTSLEDSPIPRGDFHAVVLFGYAYLAGGFSHKDWCQALKTTERYHMESDTWQTLADMNVGRADMAVASLNNRIVTIGGEEKPEVCVSDPAYGSHPSHHVDVILDPQKGKDSEWLEFGKFNDKRFRFAAAVVPALGQIYTFGGQLPFDFTCDCFPTTDDVAVGKEVLAESPEGNGSFIAAIALGSILGVLILIMVIRACMSVQRKKALEANAAIAGKEEMEFAPEGGLQA